MFKYLNILIFVDMVIFVNMVILVIQVNQVISVILAKLFILVNQLFLKKSGDSYESDDSCCSWLIW